MIAFFRTIAPVAAAALMTMNTSSRAEERGNDASPYIPIIDEAPARLYVTDPPAEYLARGQVLIQYRVENVRILPVFGQAALGVSPRIGHLHIQVGDLPWLWADPSNTNTVDLARLPPGEHKVKIDLVDANHRVFPGQSKTVRFTVPAYDDGHAH